jgi:hypothetical protein
MRLFFTCLFFLTLSGCTRENTVSSTRALDRLIVGTWVVPNQDFVTEEFEDWVSIIFKSDGTFIAPWGLAGSLVREYKGSYWQKGEFVGTRGVGGIGEGGVLAKFAHLETIEWTGEPTEGMGLIVTEIRDDYVVTQLGYATLENMAADKIQDVLNKLNDTTVPPDALGTGRTYIKIELPPLQQQF